MLLNSSLLNTALLNDSGGLGTSGGPGPHSGLAGSGRFVSESDLDLMLNGRAYAVFMRVRIADADGVLKDYSNRNSINWIQSVEYEQSLDQPIGTATVKLWREVGSKSLAPLRTDSSYNQTPFVEADLSLGIGPAIDSGRRILVDAAAIAMGSTPEDDDWHLVFEGTIDSVDWAKSPVVLECRDKGATLADTWFPVPSVITDAGNVQGALAELIDLGHLDVLTPLYVPVAPDPEVLVGSFRYDIEPVIDALLRVSQINGWDLRMRFSDEHQEFRLTYKDPGRDRTDFDFALSASKYIDVTQIKIDRTGIRNDFALSYFDVDLNDRPDLPITDYDPESVRRYGRRSMVLTEADDSPINTAESAANMLRLIKFDLAQPIVDKAIDMLYFWPVEIHDILRFSPNGTHSDDTLRLWVMGIKHTLVADGQSRTQLQVRGSAAGSYWNWLGRRPVIGDGLVPDGTGVSPNGFTALAQEPDYSLDQITAFWSWGGDPSATFDVYVSQGKGGFSLAGTSSSPLVVPTSVDIEPFHTPPDPPQAGIDISFYVVAHVTGKPDVTSGVCTASYGNGP